MSVKDDVLSILNNNKGKCFSGEELASALGVSRNAVWKAVNKLKENGYGITGVNNKGYVMDEDTDVLNADTILKYVNTEIREKLDIEVYKTIDSTNTKLKEMASKGAKEWKILVAEEQTQGRGRMNRKFYSPSVSGIYMSILLKPKVSWNEALFITTLCATAVSEAIESITGINTGIKWVNDIYVNNKKVCGILTEASLNMESGYLDYAVAGIGINVKSPEGGFPEELKDIATSVMEETNVYIEDLRCKIVASVINNIDKYYKNILKHDFMEKYKEKSILIGKNVYITDDINKESLYVRDIDDNAALVVEKTDGTVIQLSSGEVSVKQLQ